MKNFIQKLFFLFVCNFIANITSAQESPALHIELDNLNFIQWDQETNLIETYPNFTIEMWVKGTESAYGGMIYCEGKSNSNSNMFRLWVSGGKVYIRPHGNSTDQIASTGNNIFSDTRGWVHLAVVGTTPGGAGTETTLELFVDGVSNASGTYTRVANNHNRSIIGNLSSTSSQVANYQFDGEVDEFRAWSRALDVSEIANNMCNPASNTGLFRHVRFNESSGSTVYDEIAASSVTIQGTSPTWTTNSECAAMSVADEKLKSSLQVYPNPVDTLLSIKSLNSDVQISNIFIYDLTGKQLIKSKTTNTINVSNLSSGVYLLKAESVEGGVLHKKVIIN